MSSVVYMGRGSFRMEAVAVETVVAEEVGTVQPMIAAVTAPFYAAPKRRSETRNDGRTGSRNEVRADRRDDDPHRPDLRPLFGSQSDLPMLAAPTGSVGLPATPAVTISRAMLATLGGLVLLCGIVVGTAARHLLASPAPLEVVALPATPPAAVAPVVVAELPSPAPSVSAIVAAPPAVVAAPAVVEVPPVQVPTPAKTHVHARPAAKPAAAPAPAADSEEEPAKPATKPWVDPWAN